MIKKTRNQIANEIRLEMLQLDDETICKFKAAIKSGFQVTTKQEETTVEFMKRTAKEFMLSAGF